MPKDYTCPCGKMNVHFPGGPVVELQGGFLFGNARVLYVCRECRGTKRIGYDQRLLDEQGEAFHTVDRDGPSGSGSKRGKTATRKQAHRKNKDNFGRDSWTFVDE